LESIAIFLGFKNEADDPIPSADPLIPLPAYVVTLPPVSIFRIHLFIPSATYTYPLESTATPKGLLNEAFAP
jgi:hypothetical protein